MRSTMLLGPLSAAFEALSFQLPRGCIELPEAYGEHVWGLAKGRPTKYIKRVPKPNGGFRYYYETGHGGGVHAQEHMVEGARFRHGEGHFHIVKADGDKLHVRNSATGEEHTITKQALSKKLAEHHAEGLKAYRERAVKALAEAKANKASPKQVARLQAVIERIKSNNAPSKPSDETKPTPSRVESAPTQKPPQRHQEDDQGRPALKLTAKQREADSRADAHDDAHDEHKKTRDKHWSIASKAEERGDAATARAHNEAGDAHDKAAKLHNRASQQGEGGKEAAAQSKRAKDASAKAENGGVKIKSRTTPSNPKATDKNKKAPQRTAAFQAELDALPPLPDRDQDEASRHAATPAGRDFFRGSDQYSPVETPKGVGWVVGFHKNGTMVIDVGGSRVNILMKDVDANPSKYRILGYRHRWAR